MRLGALIKLDAAVLHGLKAADAYLPPDFPEEELEGFGKSYADAGVWAVQSGAYHNLASTDLNTRLEGISALRTALLRADKAGCMFVVTGAGHRDPSKPADVFAAHEDNWKPEALEVLAESCRQILADLPLQKTKLVVETWTMTPLNSPEKARELYDMVNHPNFGILFDPVNLMNLDRYFRNGEFMRECVEVMGEAIALVHLKDTILKPEAFTYHMAEAPVGQGRLDFRALLLALNTLTHANVPVMVEHLKTVEQYIECTKYVQDIADSAGIAFE